MIINENVGSKYRFIILAGQRVSQLQKGAKPRLEGLEKDKFTTIATKELSAQELAFTKINLEGEEGDNMLDNFVPPSDPADKAGE